MSKPHDRLPRWIRRVFRRLFHGTRGVEILEDLDREYAAVRERRPRAVAWGWYLAQLLRPDTWQLAWALRRIREADEDGRAEVGREVRGPTWVSGLPLDLKLAWRMLLKSPGLTVVGVMGLTLGTAVGVGFFIVFSGYFYPKLPLEEGDRIVALENRDVEANHEDRRQSLHDFITWREEMRSVDQIAAVSIGHRRLISGGAPSRPVRVAEMTAAGFQVARVAPLLGRTLVPDDEREGARLVAVLGYRLWQGRFEGDPEVIGRSVFVGDEQHVVVGVMPPGFGFPKNQELWIPLRASPTRYERGEGPELYVFGRLGPGATRDRAQAELTVLGARAGAAFPETNARLRPQILPFTYPLDDVGVTLWEAAQIQLMVTLLLVAIAVNMAVLVYARTATRQGEIAVRTALGASRRRIVAQLFIEALLLSTIAAALGLATAHLVLGNVESRLEAYGAVAFWVDFGLQPRSAAFALALAVLAAAIVGVVPGLKSTGRRLDADLRRLGGGGTVRLGRAWTALIIAQVGVAVAVLPTALTIGLRESRGLAVRSTFPAHEFLTASLGLAVPLRPGMDAAAYRAESVALFADRLQALERRLEADPAVVGVTIEGSIPGWGSGVLEVEGLPGRLRSGGRGVAPAGVATDYFELLGARIVAGRDLRGSDVAEAGGGLVVSEAFVRRVLDGGPALGQRVRFLPQPELGWGPEHEIPGPWLEIVGVVQDLQTSALDRQSASPMIYYAVAPGALQSADVLVRVRGGDANGFAPRLREITAALDPNLRIGFMANLGELRSPHYLAIAFTAILVVLGTVVLLSAAGIHALMSLTVTRRRKEIGIRTALGAHPGRLLASIFSRAAWQLGLGGIAGAIAGASLLARSGLTDAAAIPLGTVVGIMLVAGLAAAVGPARRGLRIQPMDALREE